MKDKDKPKGELIQELQILRKEREKSAVLEKGLKDSEERLKILFDYAPDAYYINDLKGNLIDGNKVAERIIGYQKEELVGKNFFQLGLLSSKDIPKAKKTIEKNKKGLSTGPEEYVLQRKDKSEIPVEISNYPVKVKGEPLVLGIARDITERKRAEKKRKLLQKKEREQHLKAETLAKVALILTSRLSLSAVLEEVLRQVKLLVPYSACNIVLIQKGGLSNIHSVGYEKYGSKNFVNNFRYPLVKIPLVKEVVKLAKSRLISDTYKNPRWIFFKETSWIRSHLVVPICLGDKVIGLLNLDDDTPGKFVKNDIKKLKPLANAAAIALENARLFEEVRKEITERKQVEELIKDSEERLKILFDYAPDAYYINDLKGNFIDGNKAAERLMGYKKEELVGKSFLKLNLLTLADIPRAAKLLVKGLRGQPTGPDVFVLNRKDNSKVTVEISTYPVKIKERTLVLGIARDITERKLAEEVLRENERRFRDVTESTLEWVWEVDASGKYIYSSPVCEKILGYKPEELLEKHFYELFVPEEQEQLKKTAFKAFANKQPFREFINPNIHKSGKLVWMSTSGVPILDKKGNLLGYRGSDRDITERKQAEEKLKKTMDATIQTMSKTIEAKDPYTSGHQQRVSQLTTAITKELNLSPDKIEGIRIASLIHDIGKIGIPTEILSKPITLTDVEFNLVKDHSQIGYDILKSIDFSYPVDQIVLQHHEKINGSGYPNNLKGDKILLEAKIIGVADVVEAMSSHRPYRPALGIDKALEEISQNKGILYDPEVVDACLKLFKEKGFKFI